MKINKKITTNVFWLLLEHGIRIGLGLVVAGILARQLGVEQYGVFQYALNLTAIFASVSFICGAELLVPLLTNADTHQKNKILGNAFAVRLFFSVMGYLGLLSYAFLTEPIQVVIVIALIGISILFSEAFGVVTAWLQSQTNSKPQSILVSLLLAVKAALILILWYFEIESIVFYALAYMIEPILIAGGLLFVYKKLNKEWFFGFSYPVALELFKKGLPFFWGLMAMILFTKLDLIMLKKLTNAEELGYFAAALQVYNNINALAPILVMSLAPILIYQQDKLAIVKRNIILISLFMMGVALVGAVVVNMIAPYVVLILFGSSYTSTGAILSSLSWVSCLFFLNQGLNIYLLKYGLGYWVTLKWLIALVVAVPLYFLLVPMYGSLGAIISSAGGYSVACLIGTYQLLNKKPPQYAYRARS